MVELDDTKEDVELTKNVGPWKDHWVIQLIAVRGEMQNTFSAPPKQGNVDQQCMYVCVCFFKIFFLLSSRIYLGCVFYVPRIAL